MGVIVWAFLECTCWSTGFCNMHQKPHQAESTELIMQTDEQFIAYALNDRYLQL